VVCLIHVFRLPWVGIHELGRKFLDRPVGRWSISLHDGAALHLAGQ